MKIVKSPLVIGGVTAVLAVTGVASAAVANAVSGPHDHGLMSELVDKISSSFNLDRAKVQQVVDDARAEHRSSHHAALIQRLQKLVDDGIITDAQKIAIETKLAELRQQRATDKENFHALTPEQRMGKMKQMRADLESWAKEQGLDLAKLRGVISMLGVHGHGHHMMHQ